MVEREGRLEEYLDSITQHVILGPGRYEVVGRVMLGLDPGSPIT